MNYIIGEDRTQIKIESIDSYVNENNEVRVIDKIVDVMDIESLGFNIGKNDTVGRPKFNPRDILKLYIYGYFNGIRSSRKLAKQCAINKEVIWLVKGLAPKYRVIADFRKDNSDAFEAVFKSFVNYCIELDLYGRELIAVDGTKLEASASKRKHYSKNKLAKMKELAQSKILEYLHDIDINDNNDDEITSKDIDKDKIVESIKRLEEKVSYYDNLENTLIKNDTNEINLTDPDAKTVKFGANQGTDVGYNVQSVVDSKNKLIATFEVINNSADQGQLYNMSKKAKDIFECETIEVLADKGYFDTKDFKKCEQEKIISYVSKPRYSNSIGNSRYFLDRFRYDNNKDIYICPEGKILECINKKTKSNSRRYCNSEACQHCKNKSKCTTSSIGRTITRTEMEQFAEIVNNRVKNNQVKYSQRQALVEHPFGTLKRSMNFYHLPLRGFSKVRGEISITFFSYNLKRVIKILGVKGILQSLKLLISNLICYIYKITTVRFSYNRYSIQKV